MKLTLVRRWFGPDKTIGKLYINGFFRYYVLEDLVRPDGEKKIYGQTAIPYGKYPVTVSHSPKLGRELPLVENVPNFSGIRIHAGKDEKWTEGCLLISRYIDGGKLVLDRPAEAELTAIIKNALHYGNDVVLSVINVQKRAFIIVSAIVLSLLALWIIFKFFIN